MKLNLGGIGSSDYLDSEQIWGIALASVYFVNEPPSLADVSGWYENTCRAH